MRARRPRTSGTTAARTAFRCAVATLVSSTAQAYNANAAPDYDDRDDADLEAADDAEIDAEIAERFAEAFRIAAAQDAGVLQPPVEMRRAA